MKKNASLVILSKRVLAQPLHQGSMVYEQRLKQACNHVTRRWESGTGYSICSNLLVTSDSSSCAATTHRHNLQKQACTCVKSQGCKVPAMHVSAAVQPYYRCEPSVLKRPCPHCSTCNIAVACCLLTHDFAEVTVPFGQQSAVTSQLRPLHASLPCRKPYIGVISYL